MILINKIMRLLVEYIETTNKECAMCGADVSSCYIYGHNENKFCRYCYYPTPKQAEEKCKVGWVPYRAGNRI